MIAPPNLRQVWKLDKPTWTPVQVRMHELVLGDIFTFSGDRNWYVATSNPQMAPEGLWQIEGRQYD